MSSQGRSVMNKKASCFLSGLFCFLVGVACVFFAVQVLYSAYCAFSWQNYMMYDYGVYTNTIYNLAHGYGFRFLVDNNYLKTHLSFSLALLAPFMRLWASPYFLIVFQWLFLAGGGIIFLRIMVRLKLARSLQSALMLLWFCYPFTQSVMLSEFHGVSFYLFLFPWLLHCLLFNRPMTAVPWICILGVREEAGLLIIPLFLLFAVREKWNPGYIFAALSLAYVVFGIMYLYPEANSFPITEFRRNDATLPAVLKGATMQGFRLRAVATGWILLPCLPFIFFLRGMRTTVFIFTSMAWIISMASGVERQFSLQFHYSAPVFTLMLCGLIYACGKGLPLIDGEGKKVMMTALFSTWLVLSVGFSHFQHGFFLGGKGAHFHYAGVNENYSALRSVTRDLPEEGILLTSSFLGPHVSARPDLLVWEEGNPLLYNIEWILFYFREYSEKEMIRKVMDSEAFGVYRCSLPFILLKKGHNPSQNKDVMSVIQAAI